MKGLKFFLLTVMLLFSISTAKECSEQQQRMMQTKFDACLNKFTQQHHESTTKAESQEEYQDLTCQMLSSTVSCGESWSACHEQSEVRTMKDMHIMARVQQFTAQPEEVEGQGGMNVDVLQCQVVKEYLASGRAEMRESQRQKCTFEEESKVQNDFQSCSYGLSGAVWSEVKDLEDARRLELRNSLKDEEEEEEENEETPLDIDKEVRPLFCSTLLKISQTCGNKFAKCFTKEDSQQMRALHLDQLRDYFSKMYSGLDLSTCNLQERNKVFVDYDGETNDIEGPSPISQPTLVPSTETPTTTTTSSSSSSSSKISSTESKDKNGDGPYFAESEPSTDEEEEEEEANVNDAYRLCSWNVTMLTVLVGLTSKLLL